MTLRISMLWQAIRECRLDVSFPHMPLLDLLLATAQSMLVANSDQRSSKELRSIESVQGIGGVGTLGSMLRSQMSNGAQAASSES